MIEKMWDVIFDTNFPYAYNFHLDAFKETFEVMDEKGHRAVWVYDKVRKMITLRPAN